LRVIIRAVHTGHILIQFQRLHTQDRPLGRRMKYGGAWVKMEKISGPSLYKQKWVIIIKFKKKTDPFYSSNVS
jgi:hypothetical protein